MIRELIEIGLAVALAVPVGLYSAQAGDNAQQLEQVTGQRVEVLSSLDEQVRLDRSVMEFAQDFSLFDDQLYGSLNSGDDQRERMKELNDQINITNEKLAQANNVLLNGWDRFEGEYPLDLPHGEREIKAEMDQMKSELASMRDQVSILALQGLFPGENVVLEISRWDEIMASGATRDILELIDASIDNVRDSESRVSGGDDI